MELICKARIINGKVMFDYPEQVISDIKEFFHNEILEIVIRKPRNTRSNLQNSYYWATVVPLVRNGLRDVGYLCNRQEAHEAMKFKFISEDIIVDGETIIEGVKSTTKLSKGEMTKYIEACRVWAEEYLNIYIPAPNEQTELLIR